MQDMKGRDTRLTRRTLISQGRGHRHGCATYQTGCQSSCRTTTNPRPRLPATRWSAPSPSTASNDATVLRSFPRVWLSYPPNGCAHDMDKPTCRSWTLACIQHRTVSHDPDYNSSEQAGTIWHRIDSHDPDYTSSEQAGTIRHRIDSHDPDYNSSEQSFMTHQRTVSYHWTQNSPS